MEVELSVENKCSSVIIINGKTVMQQTIKNIALRAKPKKLIPSQWQSSKSSSSSPSQISESLLSLLLDISISFKITSYYPEQITVPVHE